MINQLTQQARKRMDDIMIFLKKDLDSISTGRANPALLNTVRVESYGSFAPLSQLSNVSTSDASTIVVQVWDKQMVKAVEKAIVSADLGFNPMVDGQIVRISIPKLSEERRCDLVKLSKKYGEDKKILVRNARRDAIDELKKVEKESAVSKDQVHGFSDIVQKITDEYVKKVDAAVLIKEKDLMTV
jgi:ribosome recycling factor